MCRFITGKQAEHIVKRIITSYANTDDTQAAYRAFIEFAEQFHLDLSRQVVSTDRNGELISNCLLIKNPSNSANIVITELNETTIKHLKFLAKHIEHLDIAFIQCIIDESETEKKKLLKKANFRFLCHLEIMEASLAQNAIQPLPENNSKLSLIPFTEQLITEFQDTIIATYQDSLDCPEITGLRSKQEILTGHKYSGNFTPQFWWLIRYDGQNAGIILLNEATEEPSRLDLIYMGIVPKFRGIGLAKSILTHAIQSAQKNSKTKIRLAVDSKNIPAIRLYRKLGFCTIQHQDVFAILNEKRREKLKNKFVNR